MHHSGPAIAEDVATRVERVSGPDLGSRRFDMKRFHTLWLARPLTAGALAAVLLVGGSRLGATDFLRGDVNGDGTVTLSDIQPLLSWLFRFDVQPQCLNA